MKKYGAAAVSRIERIVQSVLVVVLMVLIFLLIGNVNKIQGTARVVNYAGIIRGGTQRLVKLEMSGVLSWKLENSLSEILFGLQNGSKAYALVEIKDEVYQEKLDTLAAYWVDLKREIGQVRIVGAEETDILNMSEEYFQLADEVVSAAEEYSLKCVKNINYIEITLTFVICCLVFLMLKQSVAELYLSRKNRELNQRVYTDLHTGLYNKSRCQEIFQDGRVVEEDTCCIMFDLNDLKYVNDTMGHVSGDTMILTFANILKKSIPSTAFAGRYGGDEFVVVLYGETKEGVRQSLEKIKENVDEFNEYSKQLTLRYACGCALSEEFERCTMQMLLEKADERMYENKEIVKRLQQSSFQQKMP